MEEKKVLERLQRQCARMECCSTDMYRKALKAMEGDEKAATRIVMSLMKDGFVDDRRYAAAFAREKSSLQGWGKVKIRSQLRGKGMEDVVIEDALEKIDPAEETARLDKLTAKRYRALKDDPEWQAKLLKYLLYCGFFYGQAQDSINRVRE